MNFVHDNIEFTRKSTESSPSPVFATTTAALSSRKPLMRLLPGGLCHLILNSSSKSCELNFLPPFLVKELIDEPTPLLLLCSSLLTQGCVPIIIAEKGFVFSLSSAKALIWIPLQITTQPQTFLEKCLFLYDISAGFDTVA